GSYGTRPCLRRQYSLDSSSREGDVRAPRKERVERREEAEGGEGIGAVKKVERMRQGEERPPERRQPTERRQFPKWTGPRTALFQSIFEDLEREEEKGQRWETGSFLRSRRKENAAPKWRGRDEEGGIEARRSAQPEGR